MAIVAGVDEAGRGPLAGPVVAAAVILKQNHSIVGLRDSKKLSPKKRDKLFFEIQEYSESIGIGIVDEGEIDRSNILKSTYKAMQISLGRLRPKPDSALIDGFPLPNQIIPNEGIIKGDSKIDEIMAASIIAKVTRDNIMLKYDKIFPEYGFAQHKGYGTKGHLESLVKWKASPIHRKSFKPVADHFPSLTWLRNNGRIGKIGEQLAACYLIKGKCEIIAMNQNCAPYGEIDIIAKRDNSLIFVEVKTFSKEQIGTSELKLTEKKIEKMKKAIDYYLGKIEYDGDIQIDAITVQLGKGNPSIKHFKGITLS